ncbi:MAG: cell wall-binding repeat-containing protein [Coriobacteriales bacterium]|nr:cell wall-binding repeat-containing protein [Coriobacteriales bacterium]
MSSATSISGVVGSLTTAPARATTIRNIGSEVNLYAQSLSSAVIGGIIAATGSTSTSVAAPLYLEGCYYRGNIVTDSVYSASNVPSRYSAGGIIGYAHSYTFITNCYNAGQLTAHGAIGGIAGGVYAGYPENRISNCYNSGTVGFAGGNDEYAGMGAITGYVGPASDTALFSNLYYLITSCYRGSPNAQYTEPSDGNGPIHALGSSALGSAAQILALNGTQGSAPWIEGEPYPALAWEDDVVLSADILTITLGSFEKDYGEADPELSYTVEGLLGGDSLTGLIVTREAGEDAGSYTISASNAVVEGDGINPPASYYLVYQDGTLTINKVPLTITVDAKEKAFGASDPAFTYKVAGLKGTDRLTGITITRTSGEGAGSYDITARSAIIRKGNVTTTANYDITYVKGTLTIKTSGSSGDPDKPENPDKPDKPDKPDVPPDQLEEKDWPRLDGNKGESGGRYDTMQAIVNEGWKDTGSPYVIVASGGNFPDALAASSLAGIYDAPVVLTATDTLTPQAEETIQSLNARRAYVIGGPAAVSDATLSMLESVVGAGKVTRIYGDGRIETALDIYEKGKNPEGGNTSWGNTAIIANGFSFADALSISPYANVTRSPIFLSDPSSGLNDATLSAINNGGFTKAIIVGGAAAVPESVVAQLAPSGVAIDRWWGAGRYETSADIVTKSLLNSGGRLTLANIVCATGSNYPDALAGGAFAGHKNTVLLLVHATDNGGRAGIESIIKPRKDEIGTGYVLGGTGALPDDLLTLLQEGAKS